MQINSGDIMFMVHGSSQAVFQHTDS